MGRISYTNTKQSSQPDEQVNSNSHTCIYMYVARAMRGIYSLKLSHIEGRITRGLDILASTQFLDVGRELEYNTCDVYTCFAVSDCKKNCQRVFQHILTVFSGTQ